MSARPSSGVGSLELALARALQAGTYLSIGVVAIGCVLLVVTGSSPTAGGPAFDLGRILADLAAGRPEGFLWLGILGVLATPALRVAGALIGFLGRGERTLAIVAALILGVIGIGVLAGLVTG